MKTIERTLFALAAAAALVSCQKNSSSVNPAPENEIVFSANDIGAEYSVVTRAAPVTALPSFYVSATTGAAGSETSKWTSTQFNSDEGEPPTYSAVSPGKWWPDVDESYHFYASNNALSFASGGTTISATTATDVVCAYMPTPTYKGNNTLQFKHIFARVGDVTVSAATGYTISQVSISITPKTGGTYNLRTGAGHTDDTGWSSLTTGSATSIANATPGTKENDLWLVPGDYNLTASWRAVREDYQHDYTDVVTSAVLSLEKGKVSAIDITLGGNAREMQFSISIEAWGAADLEADFPVEASLPSFGGLNIAPANLYYDGSNFIIKDADWNHESFGSCYGKTEGSYYFSFVELGKYFDGDGASFNTSSGNIDNSHTVSYGGYDDWRIPTSDEWATILTTDSAVRPGASVNGSDNIHYALVRLTGVTHAGSDTPVGLLIFPDGESVSGKALSGMDNNTCTSGVTAAELAEYLSQGCAFLPTSSLHNVEGWHYGGESAFYWTATAYNSYDCYVLLFYETKVSVPPVYHNGDKEDHYQTARLVRSA